MIERADGVSAGAATDYGGLPPNAIRLNYAAPGSVAEIEPGDRAARRRLRAPARARARRLRKPVIYR